MVTGNRIAEWLARLVQIPSVTPAQAGPRAGVPGEARIAAQVADWFREFGAAVETQEVLPGRPNTYGLWDNGSDRWIAVDVHVDTAGVEQMTDDDPFSGALREGRVYGRGAVDTKATLAVVLALLEALHQNRQKLKANLLVAATADEENSARGAPAFAQWLRDRSLVLDQLAVAEPTLCVPVYAHKGIVRLIFHIQGQASHSSQPHLGKNAITAAAHLALAIEAEHQRLQTLPPQTALGTPVLTTTLIQGGRGISVVPDTCTVTIDRRVVAEERAADVKEALIALAHQKCPLPLEVEVFREIDAFFQPPDAPWIRQMAAWSGHEPSAVPYGTNAWAYGGCAQECLVIGPGSIDQAHSAEEWVAVSELEKLAGIYARWWEID